MSANVKFTRELTVPASQVYRAFTNATALNLWLADRATVDPKPNGRFYVAWNSGYYTAGEYVKLQPDKEVVLIWAGRDDPAPSRVTITLKAKGEDRTTFTLDHAGLQDTPEWEKARDEIIRGWEVGLENLASVLQEGPDLRITRRPMLGVFLGELTPKKIEELSVPVKEGVILEGLIDGLSAQKAGLQKGDVIVALDGKPVKDYFEIIGKLGKQKAGDVVEVTYYRGKNRRQASMTLMPRPLRPTPKSAAEFSKAYQEILGESLKGLNEILDGVTEEEASFKASPEDWNVKENLAHLIRDEQQSQTWFADIAYYQEPVMDKWGDNFSPLVQATVDVYPTLKALRNLYNDTIKETVQLLAHLPDSFVNDKALMWKTSFESLERSPHIDEHIEQIKETVEKARKK